MIWQILLKLRVFQKPPISRPFIDRFSKFLCLKIYSFNNEKPLSYELFHFEQILLNKVFVWKSRFFQLLLHKQKNQWQFLENSPYQKFKMAFFDTPWVGTHFTKYRSRSIALLWGLYLPGTHCAPPAAKEPPFPPSQLVSHSSNGMFRLCGSKTLLFPRWRWYKI